MKYNTISTICTEIFFSTTQPCLQNKRHAVLLLHLIAMHHRLNVPGQRHRLLLGQLHFTAVQAGDHVNIRIQKTVAVAADASDGTFQANIIRFPLINGLARLHHIALANAVQLHLAAKFLIQIN